MNQKSMEWITENVDEETAKAFFNSAKQMKESALENNTVYKDEGDSDMDEVKAETEIEEVVEESVEEVAEEATEESVEEVVEPVADNIDVVALKEATEENFAAVADALVEMQKEFSEKFDALTAQLNAVTKSAQDVADMVTEQKAADSIPFASFSSMLNSRNVSKEAPEKVEATEPDVDELLKSAPTENKSNENVPFALNAFYG